MKNDLNSYDITQFQEMMLSQRETQPSIRKVIYKWEYYTKGSISAIETIASYTNTNSTSEKTLNRRKRNQLSLIIYLQRSIRQFLLNRNLKGKRHKQLIKLFNNKTLTNTNNRLKALLHWIHIINYHNKQHYLNIHKQSPNDNQSSSSSLHICYSYLPNVLSQILNKRIDHLIQSLKYNQMDKKGLLNEYILNKKRYYNTKAINILKKIISNRTIMNPLWKSFQLWNLCNTIIHLFVLKLNKELIKHYKLLFYTNIKGNGERKQSNNQSNYHRPRIRLNNSNDNAEGIDNGNKDEIIIRNNNENNDSF